MGDQPFVWWVRKLNLSCFHGCIPALGGGGLHLVCFDTALAVICNQKGRGIAAGQPHLMLYLGKDQRVCTHWCLDTRVSMAGEGVQRLEKHKPTKQQFLISSGKV